MSRMISSVLTASALIFGGCRQRNRSRPFENRSMLIVSFMSPDIGRSPTFVTSTPKNHSEFTFANNFAT